MNYMQKVARIVIDKRPYLAFRDPNVEGQMKENGGFGHVLRRLILTETNKKSIGCIVFYDDVLTAFSWKTDEETIYGDKFLEISLTTLLPHLPIRIDHIKETFKYSSRCILVQFDKKPDGFSDDKITYFIQIRESFFATAQRIVFGDSVQKKHVRREILQILLNAFEENPQTYLLLDHLQASIPITTKDLLVNLHFLKEEDKVDFITQPTAVQKIISVKIKAKGIHELEAGISSEVQLHPHMVKNVYGTNIENTTFGANSPINVTIDEIETVFEALQKDIEENPELKNKEKISKTIKSLETEIKERKNSNKVKQLLDELKGSANLVYQKVISNPIISGIIVELLMK